MRYPSRLLNFMTPCIKTQTPVWMTLAEFLNDVGLTEVPESMAKELDEPMRECEILEEIYALKNNKSPGPDGFINEFYKTLKEKVSTLLLNTYHYALQSGTMLKSQIGGSR